MPESAIGTALHPEGFGRTVAVLATGPSLTADDCEKVKGLEVIAVNDAYRLAPWANHLYACDGSWWDVHYESVKQSFAGKLWTQDKQGGTKPDIEVLESLAHYGLSTKPGRIHQGQNSGYQAINLAGHLLGWSGTVVLLGYDMMGKGTHFFGKHPSPLGSNTDYGGLLHIFERMHPEEYGIRVINCTRQTALTCFERMALEDFLDTCLCRVA